MLRLLSPRTLLPLVDTHPGASNYAYVEATRTQQVPGWIASRTRAFAFFGGVTLLMLG